MTEQIRPELFNEPENERYNVDDFIGLLKRQFRSALAHQRSIEEEIIAESEEETDKTLEGTVLRHPSAGGPRKVRRPRLHTNYIARIRDNTEPHDHAAILLRVPGVQRADQYDPAEEELMSELRSVEVSVFMNVDRSLPSIAKSAVDNAAGFVLRVVSPEAGTDISYCLDRAGVRKVRDRHDPEKAFAKAMESLDQIENPEDLLRIGSDAAQEVHDWVSVLELFHVSPFVKG